MHLLDAPVWHALNSHLSHLALGGPRARRFVPQVNIFAATASDSTDDLAALSALFAPGETLLSLQVQAMPAPPGMQLSKSGEGVQMVASSMLQPLPCAHPLLPLGAADAAEMLALAELTEPGPFSAETWRMGAFLGVRIDGRLAAMAGTRMHLPGWCEVSGVCTHPDFRGQGLARVLSAQITAAIQARGEQAFLHAWASNQAAQDLYRSLGFVERCRVSACAYQKP